MLVITDGRISDDSLASLTDQGFEVILLPMADYLAEAVSGHTDMLVFIGFGKLFCHANYYKSNRDVIERIASLSSSEVCVSNEFTGEKYPSDVLFNACLVGNNLICNEKTASKHILDAAKAHGCEIIDVSQGYTKCSTCIVSDHAVITADLGIAKACREKNIEVLEISEGHIALPPYDFGFIGGASGVSGDKVYFCGSLDTHPDGEKIKNFCSKHNKIAVSLGNGELQDVGSLFFIGGTTMEIDKSYWNEKYWVRHMKNDDLDHVEDLWVEEYEEIWAPHCGKMLDLGCGIGQYSEYFSGKGFDVVASDISPRALEFLSQKLPHIKTVTLDMTEPLPFDSNSFDVVFANLSIHFFSQKDTENLLSEIKRILKSGGIFIGSCNSGRAYKYIESSSTVIEPGFYMEDGGRSVRLFNAAQFEFFFADFEKIMLEEIETTRFNKSKSMWKFIYKV